MNKNVCRAGDRFEEFDSQATTPFYANRVCWEESLVLKINRFAIAAYGEVTKVGNTRCGALDIDLDPRRARTGCSGNY